MIPISFITTPRYQKNNHKNNYKFLLSNIKLSSQMNVTKIVLILSNNILSFCIPFVTNYGPKSLNIKSTTKYVNGGYNLLFVGSVIFFKEDKEHPVTKALLYLIILTFSDGLLRKPTSCKQLLNSCGARRSYFSSLVPKDAVKPKRNLEKGIKTHEGL